MKWSKYIILAALVLCFSGMILWNIGRAKGGMEYLQKQKESVSSTENTAGIKPDTVTMPKTKIEGFSILQIDMKHLDLSVKKSEDHNFYMEYTVQKNNGKNPLHYEIAGRKLSIEEKDGKNGSYYRRISIGEGIPSFGEALTEEDYNNRLVLYLPAETKLEDCRIQLKNGDADFALLCCKNLSLSSDEGDFDIRELSAENGTISSKEGDIDCSRISRVKNLSFTTEEGDISCALASETSSNTAIDASTKEGDLDIAKKYHATKEKNQPKEPAHYLANSHIQDSQLSLSTEEGDIEIR